MRRLSLQRDFLLISVLLKFKISVSNMKDNMTRYYSTFFLCGNKTECYAHKLKRLLLFACRSSLLKINASTLINV
ncbi:CLUMA_CG003962, isoform A [Clunio marinus]|uniref:CLUMA_CG003962, isoform A n=1 Tax=Clunio marinus TaxID=568069 RepID=A0A1J1HQK1_9DIPT|nr:CLUMA_CG003962, isoform A [Clunio marinus]